MVALGCTWLQLVANDFCNQTICENMDTALVHRIVRDACSIRKAALHYEIRSLYRLSMEVYGYWVFVVIGSRNFQVYTNAPYNERPMIAGEVGGVFHTIVTDQLLAPCHVLTIVTAGAQLIPRHFRLN